MCVLSVCSHNYVATWTPPTSWTEPTPAKYWSFDTLECLLLMEGIVETHFSALTSGKVFHLFCKLGGMYDQGYHSPQKMD